LKKLFCSVSLIRICAFSTLALLVGQQEGACKKIECWEAGVVMSLGQGADFAYGPADATATHYLFLE